MTESPQFSAVEIAERLKKHRPTEEQIAVIEAPLEPALVVAGAGSGKTETMAARALWLVANGYVRPAEILGLTFTRKAAGELAERMRTRIAELRAAGLVAEPDPDAAEDLGAELLDAPRVATYNSFASTLFRDHAALVGFDGDAVVLGEAASWLLAREVVVGRDDPRLAEAGKGVDAVATAVLRLASSLGEHLADADAVERMAEDYARLGEIPPEGRYDYAADMASIITPLAPLPALLDAAREFQARKHERGYLQYSDQVRIALRIAERAPGVAEELRARSKVVILDEYQDTSVGQTRLLSALFRGHSVMAVGDPHQAIYGWRGASAANLGEFSDWFDARRSFSLSTSWRNGVKVLDAANTVLEPLAARSPVAVETLTPREGADAVPISVRFEESVVAEAEAVAAWFAERLRPGAVPAGEEPPSAALLLRARATLEHFTGAFARAGVPYHVLGVGGLLAQPLAADLVAALRVIDDPSAGNELIRLLVGSRWRIGTADIAALRDLARWLEKRDLHQQELDDVVRDRLRGSVIEEESASIVDALDFLALQKREHGAIRGFSEEGLRRLREAGALFAGLRSRTRLELADLVTVTLQELDLDIEAAANEARPGSARVLEAFFDALAQFEQLGRGGSLRAFLGWLREAESRDRLSPRSDPPEPGCVQILTIHGAKGLEWDLVAVPRLVEGELPSRARDTGAWVGFGQLPYEFRGDTHALPVFAWRSATSRAELRASFAEFKKQVGAGQLDEDRRLAYVAITRARHELLLSGSFWSSQTKWRGPSRFLSELEQAGVIDALPTEPAELDVNPLLGEPATVSWPRDPLGHRRARVEAAGELVRGALEEESVESATAAAGPWARDVELLLAERRQQLAGPPAVAPPARIPASRFHEYVSDPERVTAELRRPMPERPYRATRLGTLFHAWVEHRADPDGLEEELDARFSELDIDADTELVAVDADRFAELKATFESSPWAELKPVEVEREIHLPFDGRTIVCKIDAVYERDGRIEIVDWKTGKAPKDAEDLERKQLQLALYRLAYARWAGVDPELVDAAFYFVAEDRIIRPEHVSSEDELRERWRAALG